MQRRESHAVDARAIADRMRHEITRFAMLELELIINLITAIYRAAARQVKPLVLKLQTNEERTTITFQHLLPACKLI